MSNENLFIQCESCAYCEYDELADDYVCTVYLDEDNLVKFYSQSNKSCPYYNHYDEYKIVRKQN